MKYEINNRIGMGLIVAISGGGILYGRENLIGGLLMLIGILMVSYEEK